MRSSSRRWPDRPPRAADRGLSELPVRTVFLGSGGFAVPVLSAVAEHPDVRLVGVVTAPPKPIGRRQELRPTPVGERAAASNLRLLAPDRLRAPEAVEQVATLEPDLLVLADYGQIVPANLLALPRHGALNLHPSLLPRHRGASPIPAAILAGDGRTGVTLMLMDAGLDSGPIIAQREVALEGTETAPLLEERLAGVAAELLADSLSPWLGGGLPPRPQPAEGETMTRTLRREDGRLDPAQPAAVLERQVRAYQPWPGSFVDTDAGRLVVWQARPLPAARAAEPGAIVASGPGGLALATTEGWLELEEVQPAGGRRMSGEALVRGRPGWIGRRVGAGSGR